MISKRDRLNDIATAEATTTIADKTIMAMYDYQNRSKETVQDEEEIVEKTK